MGRQKARDDVADQLYLFNGLDLQPSKPRVHRPEPEHAKAAPAQDAVLPPPPRYREAPDLRYLFQRLNEHWFDGEVPAYPVVWNKRLLSTAGRFTTPPPTIHIGVKYHTVYPDDLEDTLKHEMVHAWLYARGRPFGHTPEFYAKLAAVGASRYAKRHAALTRRVNRKVYLYQCPGCKTLYRYRRRIGNLSCGRCAKRYDPRYRLVLVKVGKVL